MRLYFEHVRFWHFADMTPIWSMSALEGKADIPDPRSDVR